MIQNHVLLAVKMNRCDAMKYLVIIMFGVIAVLVFFAYKQHAIILILQKKLQNCLTSSAHDISPPLVQGGKVFVPSNIFTETNSIPAGIDSTKTPYIKKLYGKVVKIDDKKISVNAEIYDFSKQVGNIDQLTAPIIQRQYSIVINSSTVFYKKEFEQYKIGDKTLIQVDNNIYDYGKNFIAKKILFIDNFPEWINPREIEFMSSDLIIE